MNQYKVYKLWFKVRDNGNTEQLIWCARTLKQFFDKCDIPAYVESSGGLNNIYLTTYIEYCERVDALVKPFCVVQGIYLEEYSIADSKKFWSGLELN